MEKDKLILEISWMTLWRLLLFSLLLLVLYLARNVFLILALGIVFSSALDPFVSFLERQRLPRIVGTVLIFLAGFLLLVVVFYAMTPIFIAEFGELVTKVNKFAVEVFGFGLPRDILRKVDFSAENVFQFLASGGASFFETAANVVGGAVLAIVAVILTFYLTWQKNGVEAFLKAILPRWLEDPVIEIFEAAKKKVGRWLFAQIFLSMGVGIMVFISLLFLGVKNPLALGFIAGVLEMFPVVGPLFAGALAALTALTESPSLALYTILTFIVIQQVESHLLVPLFMSRIVGLNPLSILISLLIGSQVAGFLGLILAVPAAVVFQELVETRTRQKAKQPRLEVSLTSFDESR